MCLTVKIHVLGKACVMVPLAEFTVSNLTRYTLNRVSSNKNAYNTRWCIG